MLNEKNKVIGITYATYNSQDSQNLNYAINVEYLQKLYEDLKDENYVFLNGSNITNKNYKVSTMQKFYDYTNPKRIFEDKLSYDFKEVYNKCSDDEKNEIVEIYKEIESKTYLDANPSNWETIDYIINLNVLDKEECAVVMEDIHKNSTRKNVFKLIDSYNINIFSKAVLLLTLGEYSPKDLANSDAKMVVTTIDDMSYTISEKTTILEFLGYKVNGANVNW